jgi:hypothetical protein
VSPLAFKNMIYKCFSEENEGGGGGGGGGGKANKCEKRFSGRLAWRGMGGKNERGIVVGKKC